jgi:hypothetical protein
MVTAYEDLGTAGNRSAKYAVVLIAADRLDLIGPPLVCEMLP